MIPDRLNTPNFALRPFDLDDAGAVYEYWQSDPAWERFNASVPTDYSLDDATEFVAGMLARDRATSPNWAIVHDGRVVGVVSLTLEPGARVGVIGYGVHGQLRGKGLAMQAARTVIDHAFDGYPDLARIRAHTDADNIASMRVLEKLGFSHEGTLRQNQFAKGRFVDEAIFGLLREEHVNQ